MRKVTILSPQTTTPLTSGNTPNETFADLGVHPDIVEALAQASITSPFPIQQLAIPLALTGSDLIGQARTGTGKTLAFGLTILQRITLPGDDNYDKKADHKAPQALVMCPTRELAVQVAGELSLAGKIRHARVTTIYGGVSYSTQLDDLKNGVDIVVGTPGRLLDLIERGALDLSQISIAVLDEADEMLDLGFLADVERLLAATPDKRQTLLFSATMPAAVMSLARSQLRHPINLRAEGRDAKATVPNTRQFVYQAHELDKPEIVARILQASDVNKVMIFCRLKREADRLRDDLYQRGFDVCVLHGDLNQRMREKSLKKFRTGKAQALVATDVAARGIDVTGVSHVINYECPEDDKSYVHRIGRTGRAGSKGVAVTLIDWADVVRWKVINRSLGLDFDTPVETYSTSAHLYQDLSIPDEVTGEIAEKKAERADESRERGGDSARSGKGRKRKGHERDRDRDRSRRSDKSADRNSDRHRLDEAERDEKRAKRQRKRTRNGNVTDADKTRKPRHSRRHIAATDGEVTRAETPVSTTSTSGAKADDKKKRTRKRTRNGRTVERENRE